MKKEIVFFITIILTAILSCNTTDPPIDKSELLLKLEDVSCTEAWITLTTNNIQLPAEINLIRTDVGGSLKSQILNLKSKDSLLYIDSLLPNQTYKFHSVIQPFNQSSNELSVTTLDTTSHNFSFETFTFGDIGNSVLFDAAIINENNIWCVGEIYVADTSSIGYTRYNAVHWDGNEWSLKRIPFTGSCSAVIYPPIRAIWAFSNSDIWFARGGSLVHFDGINYFNDCRMNSFLTGSINKIFGGISNDLYTVGNNGNIVLYRNEQWSKIESGTDVDLIDVWGTPDGSTVWAAGKNLSKTILIKIENNQARIVFEDQSPWQVIKDFISGGLSSIWTNSNNFIYATTPVTAYRCLSSTSGEGKEIYPYDDYLYGGTVRIRGTAANNIITAGNNGSILHFNGYSWKRFEELTDQSTYLWSTDIKNRIIVSVGDKFEGIFDYKAVIIVGKK